MCFAAYVLCCLRLHKLKLKEKKFKQKTLKIKYKTEIKFLANPGLA